MAGSHGPRVGTRWAQDTSSYGTSCPLVSSRKVLLSRQVQVGTGNARGYSDRLRNRRSQVRILSGALERSAAEGTRAPWRRPWRGNEGGNTATVTGLPVERTQVPGVYRRGGKFVAIFRERGRQHKQSASRWRRHARSRWPTRTRHARRGGDRRCTRSASPARILSADLSRLRRPRARSRPRAVQHFVERLTNRPGRGGRLCDRSIANAMTPLRPCTRGGCRGRIARRQSGRPGGCCRAAARPLAAR